MRVKTIRNRLVSLLLAGCMLVTLLPVTGVLAAASPLEDVTLTATSTSSTNRTVSGTGNKVLTFTAAITDPDTTLKANIKMYQNQSAEDTTKVEVLRFKLDRGNIRLSDLTTSGSSTNYTTMGKYADGQTYNFRLELIPAGEDTKPIARLYTVDGDTKTQLGTDFELDTTNTVDELTRLSFAVDSNSSAGAQVAFTNITYETGVDLSEEPEPDPDPEPAPDAVYTLDFEDESSVDIQNQQTASDADVVQVTDFGGGKVLEIKDSDAASGVSRGFFQLPESLSGKFTLSYDMYVLSDLENAAITFVCGSKENSGKVATSTANQILRLKTTAKNFQHKGGGDSSTTSVGEGYTQETWFNVKIAMDTDQGTYTIYLDNSEEALASGKLSYSAADTPLDKIDNLGFMTDSSGVAHVYIDNIQAIVEADEPEPTPSESTDPSESTGPSESTSPEPGDLVETEQPEGAVYFQNFADEVEFAHKLTAQNDTDVQITAFDNSKVLEIRDEDTSKGISRAMLTLPEPVSGEVTISYKLYDATNDLGNDASAQGLTFVCGSQANTGNPATAENYQIIRLKASAGNLQHRSGDAANATVKKAYTQGEWATVKLVLNTAEKTYAFYVGDAPEALASGSLSYKAASSAADQLPDKIDNIGFVTDGAGIAHMYVDDITITTKELEPGPTESPDPSESTDPTPTPSPDPELGEPPAPPAAEDIVRALDFEGTDDPFKGNHDGAEVIADGDGKVLEIADSSTSATSKAIFDFAAQSGKVLISFKVKVLDGETTLYMGAGSHALSSSWTSSNAGRSLRLTFSDAGHVKAEDGAGTDSKTATRGFTENQWVLVQVALDTEAGTGSVWAGDTPVGTVKLGYQNGTPADLGQIDNIAFFTNTAKTAHAYIDDVVISAEGGGATPPPATGGTEYWTPPQRDGETFTTSTDQVIATLPVSGVTMAVGAGTWTVTDNKDTPLNGVTYTKHMVADKAPKVEQGTGEYFKFTIPDSIEAGELVVCLRVNGGEGKALHVLEDGVPMAGYEDPQSSTVNVETAAKLAVLGGKTYTVYVSSSMAYFYGFSFRKVDKEADMAAFQAELDKLGFDWIRGENTDPNAVDKDLNLTTFYTSPNFGGADVNWTSNSAAVSGDGKVNRLAEDTLVTLTAHISVQQISYLALDKTFQVTVKALADDAEAVARAKEALSLGAISAVKKDLELPSQGMHGTTITWQSSDPDVVTVDAASGLGVIHPNDATAQTVTLTATIRRGNVTDTKEFVVTVAAAKILDVNSWAYATGSGAARFVPTDGGKLHSINVTNNNQHLDTNDYQFKVEILGPDGAVKGASQAWTASAFFTHGPGVSENVPLDLPMDSGDTFRVTAYDDAKTYVTFTHGAADDTLAPGAKIYVIGDSTAAAYDNSKYPQTGWAQVLEGFFDGVEVVDLAIPGRSSLDYTTRPQFQTLKESIQPGDYLIIQFGHNDSHNADSTIYTDPSLDRFADGEHPSYKKHMAQYVTLAWDAGAYPIIATSISRRKLDDATGELYGNAARALAEELSVPCVDVLAATNGWVNHVGLEESIDMFNIIKPVDSRFYQDEAYQDSAIRADGNNAVEANWDNTHVNMYGAKLIAMFAADGIKALGIPVGTRRSDAVVSTTLPHYADAFTVTASAPLVTLPEALTVTAEEGSSLQQYPVSGAGSHTLTFTVTPSAEDLGGGVKFFTGVGSAKREVLRLEMDNGTLRLIPAPSPAAAYALRTVATAAEGVVLGSYTPGQTYTFKTVLTPRLGEDKPAQVEVYRLEGQTETQMGETCVLESADVTEITRLDFFAETDGQGELAYTDIDFQTEIIPELEYVPATSLGETSGGEGPVGPDKPDEPDKPGTLPGELTVTAGTSSVTNKFPVNGSGNQVLRFTVTPSATEELSGGVKFFTDGAEKKTEVLRLKLDKGTFKLAEVIDGAANYVNLGSYTAGTAYALKVVLVPKSGDQAAFVKVYQETAGGQTQLGETYSPREATLSQITQLDFFADSNRAGTYAYTGIQFQGNATLSPEESAPPAGGGEGPVGPSAPGDLLWDPSAWTLDETGAIQNGVLTVTAGEDSGSNRVDVSGEGVKTLSFQITVDVEDLKDLKGGVNFRDEAGNTVLRFKLQNGGLRLSDLRTDAAGKTVYKEIGGRYSRHDSFHVTIELYPATKKDAAYVKVYKDGVCICDSFQLTGEGASTLENITRLYVFTDSNTAGTYTYQDMTWLTGAMTPAQTGAIDFKGDGWKLQLPVEDPDKKGSVLEKSPAELAAGYSDEYFYAAMDDAGDYAVVFHSPVEGFKTTNAKYARSELRELLDPNDNKVNWTWQGGHILTTEERVTHVPASGEVITAQIHGIEQNGDNANPLVKVRYVYDASAGIGKVVVELKNTTSPTSNDFKYTFPNVALGQKYRTEIRVVNGVVYVTVSTTDPGGGERAETYSHDFVAADPYWKETWYYFKVGSYIQDNTDASDGAYADVWVYSASIQHNKPGSSSGGGPRPSTDRADYSDGGSTVEETWADGTTVITQTASNGDTLRAKKDPDGTVHVTVQAQNGSADLTTAADGRTEGQVIVSEAAERQARSAGTALTLPVPRLTAGADMDSAPKLSIVKSEGLKLWVELPVKTPGPGIVPVLVRADGTREIIRASAPTRTGVIFAISGSATVLLVDNAQRFNDVAADHWAADAVAFVGGRELLQGVGNASFAPEGVTDRAMVVTVLARLAGVDTSGGATWYEKGMDWAVAQGVSDGTAPEAQISREQFVTMLYRDAGQPAVTGRGLGGFADGGKVSSWARSAVEWAVETGVMQGRTGGVLDPQGGATRAEAAAFLMRYGMSGFGLDLPTAALESGPETPETVVLDQDFEGEKLGRSWAVGTKAVAFEGAQVAEITDSDPNESTALNLQFAPQTGKVAISFRLYIPADAADSAVALTVGDQAHSGKYSSSTAGEFLRVKTLADGHRFQFRGGDSAKTPSVNAGSYRPGEWVELKVVVDTDTQTFSVYADGELLGENQPVSNKGGAPLNSIDNITFMTEKAGLAHAYVDDVKVTRQPRNFSLWDESLDGYRTITGAAGSGLLSKPAQWQLKQGQIADGALTVTAGEDSASNRIAVSGGGNQELAFTVTPGAQGDVKGGVRFMKGGQEILRFKLDSGKFKITDMRTDEAGKTVYQNLGSYEADVACDIQILLLPQAALARVYADGRQLGSDYALRPEAAAAVKGVDQLNFFTDKNCSGTLTYRDLAYQTGVDAPAEQAPTESTPPSGDTPAGTGCIDFLGDGWKIQLPVEDPSKAGSVLEKSPQELASGYTDQFIYAARDENGAAAVVFHSPVEGYKTGNTSYARSELRELLDPNDSKVNWTWQGTHVLTTEERVTHVPASGEVITSQIHGIEQNGDNANPLVKVRYVYEASAGTGKVVVELKNTTSPTSYDFKYTFPGVALGQKYRTEIRVVDGVAYVTVSTTDPGGGERSETYYHDFVAADPYWKETWYYFKVGNYIQDNEDKSDGAYADVWVYSAAVDHSDAVEKIPVSGLAIDQSGVAIRSGERTGLTVTAAPVQAYDKSVIWSVSAGADVAVVDRDGYVTGLKEGVATVTATSVSNPAVSASCSVTVRDDAEVEARPIFAADFEADGAKTDPSAYGGADCAVTWDAPAGTAVAVEREAGNGAVTLRDDTDSAPAKLSFVFAPQTQTTTIAFRLRVNALGTHGAGSADCGRMYAVAAGSDSWYTNDNELFRIRNTAKGTPGSFSGLTYVLTDHYDEIVNNADKVVGGYGDWVDVVYVVTPNNGTAKANTTDVYMNGYPVALGAANRNSVDYVNRLDIQTGTGDQLSVSVDDVKIYTGIVLPESAALVRPTSIVLTRVPSVMAVSDSAQAVVETAPAGSYERVNWSVTSGDAIAVSEDGYVTAARPGTAVLRAESALDSGVFAQQTVTVQSQVIRPQSISAPATLHVAPGAAQRLQVTVAPENATEKGVKYEVISGGDVASVNGAGVVTGKAVGSATVRVTSLSDPEVYANVAVSVTETLTPGELIYQDDFAAGSLDSARWTTALAKDNTFVELADGAMTFIDANTAANPKVTLNFAPASGQVSIQFRIKVDGQVTLQGGSTKSTGHRNLRIAFGAGNITATANEAFCIRGNGTHFTYNTSGADYKEMPGDYDVAEWNEMTLVSNIRVDGPDTTDVYVNGVKVLAGAPNKVDYPAIDKLCFSADTANVAAFTVDDLMVWAGGYDDKPVPGPFSDVAADHWAAEAIREAGERGLLNGVGGGAFAPNATTTRATVITLLARLAGADTAGGATWYEKGMAWAVAQGISDGSDPDAPISREQFVTLLYRCAGQPAAARGLDGFADGGQVSAWAAPAVAWAVEAGLLQGRADGSLDPAGTTTRAEAAALLVRYCHWSES